MDTEVFEYVALLEAEVYKLRQRVEAQRTLLVQLQEIVLLQPDPKSSSKGSKGGGNNHKYHEHKNDVAVLERGRLIMQQERIVPWHVKKRVIDEMFPQ